jgi:HAD superfamily hydrolase (TIGR01549 family)
MLKTVIFDFDGVIAESVDIKTEAFRELFKGYPHKLKEIERYHLENGGLSRFEKFRYIYQRILSAELTEEALERLCLDFNKLVVDKVVAADYVKGAKEFLDYCKSRYKMYIVSGTPEGEIREIVARRGLGQYFAQVYGSPENKWELIAKVLSKDSLNTDEVLFIGDSKNDLQAALQTKVRFVARAPEGGGEWLNSEYISFIFSDFRQLRDYFRQNF